MSKNTRDTQSMSGVIRVKKNKDYSITNNTGARDERLSWGAKGVLWYALTRPDGWELNLRDLLNRAPEGEAAVKRMLRELKTFGYLKKERHKLENGKFEWVTTIYEVSQGEDFSHQKINSPAEKPSGENQPMEIEKPSGDFHRMQFHPMELHPMENRPIYKELNKEVLNKQILNKGLDGVGMECEIAKTPNQPTDPDQNLALPFSLPEPIKTVLDALCEYGPNLNHPRDRAELEKLLPFLQSRFGSAEAAAAGILETYSFWDRDKPPKLSRILSEWGRMEKLKAAKEKNATTQQPAYESPKQRNFRLLRQSMEQRGVIPAPRSEGITGVSGGGRIVDASSGTNRTW